MTSAAEEYNTDEFSMSKFFTGKTLMFFLLAFFLIAMFAFFSGISISELLEDLSSANQFFLLIGFTLSVIAILVDGFSWWLLLYARKIKLSLAKSSSIFFSSFITGYLISSMGMFETVVRTAMTQKVINNDNSSSDEKVNSGDILSTIILHRLLGSFSAIIVVIVIAWVMLDFGYYDSIGQVTPFMAAILILFIITIALIMGILTFLSAKYPEKLIKKSNSLLKWLGTRITRWEEKLTNMTVVIDKNIHSFSDQMQILSETKLISFGSFLCTLLPVIIRSFSFHFYFRAFDIDAPFFFVMTMSFILGTIDLIPIAIPGMEGFKEIGMTALLVLRPPYEEALSFSASIMTRFLNFYLMTTIGLIIFYYLDKTIKNKSKENVIKKEEKNT